VRLLLVRHAETANNRDGLVQGRADHPLDATGLAQAAALADSLRGVALCSIYSSPLQRALQLSSGAIVLGLGRWGELTTAQIGNLVRQGALHYVLQLDGTVPGPVIRAKVGDTIDIALTNKAIMGHSIDFHAALAPPDLAYQTVQPGKTLHFSWQAKYPGAFLYHCGTPPVLAHISNGMYGAIIIDPQDGWGTASQEYVLVQSEFYPARYPGSKDEYYGDLGKMKAGIPDVVTFNGIAFRYKTAPLIIKVGNPVRVFIVNAGPSHFSAFHVVGTVFSAVYADGNPANKSVGLQTASVPPGGAAVVEFAVEQSGVYPFVTHSFGDADEGALGLFRASN